MNWPRRILCVSVIHAALVAVAAAQPPPARLSMSTWSIAAIDPMTGDVGVAAASCVPDTHADALAALVPGFGVAVTQATWTLENRNRVFAALRQGASAPVVIARVADPGIDGNLGDRQYGVVTLTGDDGVEIAGFTGEDTLAWSGIRSDQSMAVTVQGNILVGEAVVSDALAAFLRDDPAGSNWLSDRLLRALEAGSAAGGDIRCNSGAITSTAATAFIVVARAGDPPYAAENIRRTDQGTDAAPWLAISEAGPREAPNPVHEVRRRYDLWRAMR